MGPFCKGKDIGRQNNRVPVINNDSGIGLFGEHCLSRGKPSGAHGLFGATKNPKNHLLGTQAFLFPRKVCADIL